MKTKLTLIILATCLCFHAFGQTFAIPQIPIGNNWIDGVIYCSTDSVSYWNNSSFGKIAQTNGNPLVVTNDGSGNVYIPGLTVGLIYGNASGLVSVPASQIFGTIANARLPSTLTNNSTGNAAVATNAQSVPWTGVTGAPAIGATNGFITKSDATNVVNSLTNSMSIGGTAANANSLGGVAAASYLTSIPIPATNQFLTSVPIPATNQFLVSIPVGATNQFLTSIPTGATNQFLTTNGNAASASSVPATGVTAGALPAGVTLTTIPPSVLTNHLTGFWTNNYPALYGQPWAAMQKPWAFIYFCPALVNGKNEGESYITNFIIWTSTNGMLAAWTNNYQMAVFSDVGWDGGRVKGTNWPYITNNWGTLTVNTNFPNGFTNLASFFHGYGLKFMAQIYDTTNVIPAGADEWICDAQGNGFQPWTNGVGTFPTNLFGPYVTLTGPDTAAHDISELSHWGLDGFVLADGVPSDTYQSDAIWGNASLNVSVPVYSTPSSYFTYPALSTVGKVMAYIPMQTSQSAGSPYTYGFQTIGSHSGVMYDNNAQSLSGVIRDFATTTKANQGAYVVWQGGIGGVGELFIAMTHGLPMAGGPNDTILYSAWNGFTNMLMNTNLCAVWNDTDQNWPHTLFSNPSTTCIYEKTYNGNLAAMYRNSTNTTQVVTIPFTSVGLLSNVVYDVKSPSSVPPYDWGQFTNSFAETLSSFSSDLIIISPVPISPISPSSITVSNGFYVTKGQAAMGSYVPYTAFGSLGAGQFPSGTWIDDNVMQLAWDNNNGSYSTTIAASWNTSGFLRLGARYNNAPIMPLQINVSGTGYVVATNSLSVSNSIFMQSESVWPAPQSGGGWIDVSNTDAYWVTPSGTNKLNSPSIPATNVVGTLPNTALNYRAGIVAVANLATSTPITFSSPFSPTIGTNYSISLTPMGFGAVPAVMAASPTTNGLSAATAAVAGGGFVFYFCIPNQ